MTDESNDIGPGALWALGNERLTAAADETRSYGERAAITHMAGLYFASSQARSLAILAEHLPALVEQQKAGNAIAALHHPGVLEDVDEFRAARAKARQLLGLDNPAPSTPQEETP